MTTIWIRRVLCFAALVVLAGCSLPYVVTVKACDPEKTLATQSPCLGWRDHNTGYVYPRHVENANQEVLVWIDYKGQVQWSARP